MVYAESRTPMQDAMREALQQSAENTQKKTEMMALGEMLGQNRRRLREMLALAEERLNNFAPALTLIVTGSVPPADVNPNNQPDPLPGTLANLRHLATSTGEELSRLDAICTRLTALL